jgi:hypothetical protein
MAARRRWNFNRATASALRAERRLSELHPNRDDEFWQERCSPLEGDRMSLLQSVGSINTTFWYEGVSRPARGMFLALALNLPPHGSPMGIRWPAAPEKFHTTVAAYASGRAWLALPCMNRPVREPVLAAACHAGHTCCHVRPFPEPYIGVRLVPLCHVRDSRWIAGIWSPEHVVTDLTWSRV